ncbi:outer-membrane lipoprotein carrier protein LolA [Pelagibacteraceae bacterium]|jgi:outer membrane lipoprotein-sorting protein|nr:outer-membrane lipoprotein carrier protein LolA [Pelagibacteraceae bacterium]|tara:strand:- start:244 stop:831 length:588 start_codon:yes stop_codon:yes gene_type:complete
MLVKERFYSLIPKNILVFLIILFNFQHSLASEKDEIIKNLKKTESIRFNFTQNTNGLIESGKCILLFPKKLKCNYSDKKLKELIINEDKMSITQKRYNKTYFYPLSKSPFLKILDKKNLIELISQSNIEIEETKIKLISNDSLNQEIIVMFEKNSFNLLGWKIKDQYNNEISFLIKINSTNNHINNNNFIIPYVN